MKSVIVVGGGPAGLSAAIHAAAAGSNVVLMEHNGQCGAKLLTTGGGHCNVTNLRPESEWPPLFGRNGRFIHPALVRMSRVQLEKWLAELGEPTAVTDGFHVFPVSGSARAVRDALMAEAERLGVDIRIDSRVQNLIHSSTKVRGVIARGVEFWADAVIIATGGKSYPALGATWDGCVLAEEAGHRIAAAYPGLVGLRAQNLDAELAGLVVYDTEVFLKCRGKPALRDGGELLLTHGGVSGPAVLDLSASAMQAFDFKENAGSSAIILTIRWLAGRDEKFWLAKLAEWRTAKGAAPVSALIRTSIPQRLARWLCAYAGVKDNAKPATLTTGQRDRLASALGGFHAAITGCEGWDRAMVTRGGVDVREIDPDTMESTLLSGLYFAGETVDMDGPCGGYNLHWAFASGALAGESASALM